MTQSLVIEMDVHDTSDFLEHEISLLFQEQEVFFKKSWVLNFQLIVAALDYTCFKLQSSVCHECTSTHSDISVRKAKLLYLREIVICASLSLAVIIGLFPRPGPAAV